MASSLFNGPRPNPIAEAVNRLRAMGNPATAYEEMYRSDPNFRSFADSMVGKTPEQAFKENGLDFGSVRRLFR